MGNQWSDRESRQGIQFTIIIEYQSLNNILKGINYPVNELLWKNHSTIILSTNYSIQVKRPKWKEQKKLFMGLKNNLPNSPNNLVNKHETHDEFTP